MGPADPLAPLIEDHQNGFLQNVYFLDYLLCVIFLFLGYKVRKSENDIGQHLKDFFLQKSESDCSHLMLLL